MKNLVSASDLTVNNLEEIFSLTDSIKKNKHKFSNALDGKIIATLFYEPSTRTRLSFESAILQLGAKFISTENARDNSSAWKGESVEDTVRTIENYADAIIIRNSDECSIKRAAAVASAPIINAGNGSAEHPTQAILDIYTIKELKGDISNIQVAILGDLKHGRTAHSLIKLLSLYTNVKIYGFSINGLELPKKYIECLENKNIEYYNCTSFDDIPFDIDIIYQTRVQKERLDCKVNIGPPCINASIMKRFSKSTYIMHPLPRGKEIDPAIDTDQRAVYFKQAQNGLYTRMALLLKCLTKW